MNIYKVFTKNFSKINIAAVVFCTALLFSLPAMAATSAPTSANVSAWLAEWDIPKGLEDAQDLQPKDVVLFAAYFDMQGRPFLTEPMQRLINSKRKLTPEGGKLYLSVVNDVVYAPGKALQKDPSVVKNIVANTESRQKHKADLLRLLASGPFDGLEIDYEKVDPVDWPLLLDFVADLEVKSVV